MFPGANMDVIAEKLISTVNQKEGGRLCKKTGKHEVMFFEQIHKETNEFTFRFSSRKEDYIKCKYAICSKIGYFDRVPCLCVKQYYCSKICMEKDISHKSSCDEVKKREYDP